MNRNPRNTEPPTRATTAPTTITVVVVVLERLDDVVVGDGSGVTGVVVMSETGAEEMLDARPVEESGR